MTEIPFSSVNAFVGRAGHSESVNGPRTSTNPNRTLTDADKTVESIAAAAAAAIVDDDNNDLYTIYSVETQLSFLLCCNPLTSIYPVPYFFRLRY